MNFEPYDNSSAEVIAPSLSTIMEIVERRQRRRYQVAGVGAMAGLAAAGAVMTNVFQRSNTTIENVEAAGEVINSNQTGQATTPANTDEASAPATNPTTSELQAPETLPAAAGEDTQDDETESADTPTVDEPTTSTVADTTQTTAETTTTSIPSTTVPPETITSSTVPEAICPTPDGSLDNGAWIGRGLVRFDQAAVSQADAEALASAWVIPETEAQALLGLGAGSRVNLMNDLDAITIWDNWAADYQVGPTLATVAGAWQSTSISVKALYLIGEPAAVEAVKNCPPA